MAEIALSLLGAVLLKIKIAHLTQPVQALHLPDTVFLKEALNLHEVHGQEEQDAVTIRPFGV